MENEIATLSENDKIVLAFKAGASCLEDIINEIDGCVNVENTVPDNDPNANVFKFQHKSGRVYNLTQRVVKHDDNSNCYEIVWGLVTCSMNGVLYNLTNLRRHNWNDWLTDDTIAEKQQYGWFRFHGKRLWNRDCTMVVSVYDDGKVFDDRPYTSDWIDGCLLNDTKHLADRIQQRDLKADSDYISGNRKRKQMHEVVNSVMAIEGPAECIAKAFDSNIFKLIQTVEHDNTVLFDEVNIASVTVNLKAILPAFEDRIAFSFTYQITINTQDYTTKCYENQKIDLYCKDSRFEVRQMFKGTMPFKLQFDMTPNREKYTNSSWRDYQPMPLSCISNPHHATGKSFVQEFADNYSAMKPIVDAVKGVC
jgi:hypothetical protein